MLKNNDGTECEWRIFKRKCGPQSLFDFFYPRRLRNSQAVLTPEAQEYVDKRGIPQEMLQDILEFEPRDWHFTAIHLYKRQDGTSKFRGLAFEKICDFDGMRYEVVMANHYSNRKGHVVSITRKTPKRLPWESTAFAETEGEFYDHVAESYAKKVQDRRVKNKEIRERRAALAAQFESDLPPQSTQSSQDSSLV